MGLRIDSIQAKGLRGGELHVRAIEIVAGSVDLRPLVTLAPVTVPGNDALLGGDLLGAPDVGLLLRHPFRAAVQRHIVNQGVELVLVYWGAEAPQAHAGWLLNARRVV